MKIMVALAISVLLTTSVFARPVRIWSYEDLFNESDVVAIVKVKSITDTTARLDGHGDPNQFQGKRADIIVGLSLKGERQQVISFSFFTYRPNVPRANGGRFADLSKAGEADFLVFLKNTDDGTLIPVSGHYDAVASIIEVSSHPYIRINESTQQGGPGYPPQGVGSPDP